MPRMSIVAVAVALTLLSTSVAMASGVNVHTPTVHVPTVKPNWAPQGSPKETNTFVYGGLKSGRKH